MRMSEAVPTRSMPLASLPPALLLAALLHLSLAVPATVADAVDREAGDSGAAHPHIEIGDERGDETWPLQMHLDEAVEAKLETLSERAHNRYRNRKQRREMAVLAWTPPDTERIRGVLIIAMLAHSIAFGEHEAMRKVAKRHELGIIYLRSGMRRELIPGILEQIAGRTGIAEYRHAPWVTWGMSANGRFPTYMTWAHPDRSIASIVWHGDVPPWGGDYPPDWARFDHTHLHVNLNGQSEWDRTWHRHVRPGLLNYRVHKGWLPHQVVAPGTGHGDHPEGSLGQRHGYTVERTEDDPVRRMSRYEGFDYMALFIDKAVSLRLPDAGYPTEEPLELQQVDEERGYLIHPRAIEHLLDEPWRPLQKSEDGKTWIIDPQQRGDAEVEREEIEAPLIQPAGEVEPDQRKHRFWVADRELAEAWWHLHAIDDQPFPLDRTQRR